MALFRQENRDRSERSQRIYAAFEIAYTVVDFGAAIAFLVGSVLFFRAEWESQAIWCFVVGSVLFCVKPSLRLVRELRLAALGDDDDLVKRYRGEP